MQITIIGAGAMGTLFGGYLGRAGHSIYLVERDEAKAAAIATAGIEVEGVGGDFSVPALRCGPEYSGPPPDLLIVCVKAYDTEAAAAAAASWIGPSTTILTLQNGIGNLEHLGWHLPREALLAGTTAIGANLLGPGRVHHAGEGVTHIGPPGDGVAPAAEKVCRIFSEAGLPAEVCDTIDELIWSKLVVNVGINALTSILRVRNGRLLAIEAATRIMDAAVAECAAVASASGIDLPAAAAAARVREVARLTASNKSSMLVDVLEARPTEIEAINGAVVRRGEELGVPTPVNRTLADILRSIEGLRLEGVKPL